MATTQSTLVAVFRSRGEAENAANDLKANGYDNDQVYVGSYTEPANAGASREWSATHHHEGGIKGWFKSLFGQDDDATEYRDYENAANSGAVIVSVETAEQDVDRAMRILESHNPLDITEDKAAASSAQSTEAGQQARSTPAVAASGKRKSDDLPASLSAVEEDIRVGKRSVRRGGVRVYSRVTERPVEETVNLREEHVRVERQPINRSATANDLKPGTQQVIEVEEFAEEPVIQKQARVVEEVRVSKDVSERNETIRDTVRSREIEVEDLSKSDSGASGADTLDSDFRRDFESRYASSGSSYADYEPAYAYGYNVANDPRYQGRSWDEVESDLRSEYGRRYPISTWEKMKASVRYGWDKVTGRTRSAAATR